MNLALRSHRPIPDAASLLAALPVACILLDQNDRFCAANPAAEEFFGLSFPHLRQIRLVDLIPQENPIFDILEHVRVNEVTISERGLSLESPRLTRHDVAVHCALLPENPDFAVLTFQDGTAARALDRQVSFKNAARSVAGMASMLAHEVKNPLSGIRGAAQLLENSVAPNDRELAILIRDEADRIRALVERMEIFGDHPVERGPVNIHRVLEHVRRLALSGFAAHIKISESYDPSLPSVWGHRDQLIQVVLNLVKNAAEAITEGGGEGEITLFTAYQPGVRVAVPGQNKRVQLPLVVTVRDTGPGIPEALRDTLFDPFITTKAAGTGLGLAMAAKIIGDHGGLMEVESSAGRTEFRLFLPVAQEDSAVPGPR